MSALDIRSTCIRKHYLTACHMDVEALKPGNVGNHSAGHDMEVGDFLLSAERSVTALCDADLSLGERIYRAIHATRQAVGCNTNLGIVLLCAPLAEATLKFWGVPQAEAVARVLDNTTVEDADWTYQAIRLASPGGLGSSDEQDVNARPEVDLLRAMQFAADRDRIAECYSQRFEPVVCTLRNRYEQLLVRWGNPAWAACGLYMSQLGSSPDSHILRKFGRDTAQRVVVMARPLWEKLSTSESPWKLGPSLMQLDAELKNDGLNPGTTADLTVGALFAAGLAQEFAQV